MQLSKSKGTKILYILKFLWDTTDDSHYAKSAEISDYLLQNGITAERKSIYSDITLLKEFGFAIENVKGKNGGYYIADRTFELAELKILLDGVVSSKFITEKKSYELIKKLETLCSKYEAKELITNVYVTNRIKSMNESILYNVDFINSAINENKKVSFKYFDYNINKKKVFRHDAKIYLVSPYALVLNNGNYYLVASEGEGDVIKHYRIDKMTNINISFEDRVKDNINFDVEKYAQQHFSMYGGEIKKVTIRFENSLSSAVIDRFGYDVFITKEDDGKHFNITTELAVSTQFLGWIFGFGGKAQIISPPDVANMMKEQLTKLSQQYKNV